jgi:uncharacterized LabA/DUF88 family protein
VKGKLLKQFNRIAIFIDGANLYSTAKLIGFEIDFKRLLHEFRSRGSLLRAFYYTTIYDGDEHPSLQPLIAWLAYNGFVVVTKPAKEFNDQTGRRKIKGGINVELTIDAMEIAPRIDKMFLFSGDGDFHPLLKAMQRRGARVVVVSSMQTAAQELRRQADEFIDIADLRDKIGRDSAARQVRPTSEDRGSRERSYASAPAPRNRARIVAGGDERDDED